MAEEDDPKVPQGLARQPTKTAASWAEATKGARSIAAQIGQMHHRWASLLPQITPQQQRNKEDLIRRSRALEKIDPEAAEVIDELPIKKAYSILRHLRRPRGRTPNKGAVIDDNEFLIELRKAVTPGEKPTTVAKRLILQRNPEMGKEQLKNRADYLVTLLKSGK